MLSQLAAGDFVIIQFGHNDSGATNAEPPGSTRPLRARGTIPGIGTESEEIDNVLTGRHETVYTYGWYVRKMIADVRSKQATPILMTLTKTNNFKEGRIECPAASYRLWTWQTAQAEKTAFVDLTRLIADRYQREGPEAVKGQFIDDTVHTNIAGATANARDVVAALRADRALPFRKMLSKAGGAVAADRGPSKTSVCATLD
jgi:lysophospholipase L1-like esterase